MSEDCKKIQSSDFVLTHRKDQSEAFSSTHGEVQVTSRYKTFDSMASDSFRSTIQTTRMGTSHHDEQCTENEMRWSEEILLGTSSSSSSYELQNTRNTHTRTSNRYSVILRRAESGDDFRYPVNHMWTVQTIGLVQ